MRIARLFTVAVAAVTATAALVAVSAPVSADSSYIYPSYDPLRSVRYLVASDVSADQIASPGTFAIDTDLVSPTINWDISKITTMRRDLDNTGTIGGYCTYTRTGVGLEGGGVTFTVAGEATAAGRYKGAEIVATGIRCILFKPDMTISVGPEFAPGPAVAATTSADSYDARGGTVCAEAWALLRHVPAGMSSALVSTGLNCHGTGTELTT